MMANKWVQASLLLGITVGLFLGVFLSLLVHPVAALSFVPVFGFMCLIVTIMAKGTNGWSKKVG